MVSGWWRVCRDLGYPELDVRRYEDGEYALIQYFNTPIIPSLTKWQAVLTGIRNVEMSASFIKAQADKLNLERGAVWDGLDRRDREILSEIKSEEDHSLDFAAKAADVVKRCPTLMDRIARRGTKELDFKRMVQHIDSRDLSDKHRKGLKRL